MHDTSPEAVERHIAQNPQLLDSTKELLRALVNAEPLKPGSDTTTSSAKPTLEQAEFPDHLKPSYALLIEASEVRAETGMTPRELFDHAVQVEQDRVQQLDRLTAHNERLAQALRELLGYCQGGIAEAAFDEHAIYDRARAALASLSEGK
jgi:hypothetical protein